MAISLPTSLITKFNEGIDAIIELVKVPCVLSYTPKITSCPNCYIDPNTGKSNSRHKSGGPIPFATSSICPYCNGLGQIQVNVDETVYLCVYFSPKDFKKLAPNIEVPAGAMLTKGYMSDYPKIQKAIELSVHSNTEGITNFRYKRFKEVIPSGFKSDRYFLQFWERA